MARVACKLAGMISEEEYDRIVGIGNSGRNFARFINPECENVSVQTTEFNRDRTKRKLQIGQIATKNQSIVLCDDVAVSGETIRQIVATKEVAVDSVLLGLKYASRKTQKRIGVDDLRCVASYSNENGGKTPINSFDALKSNNSGVLDSLTEAYFCGSEEFKEIIKQGEYDE